MPLLPLMKLPYYILPEYYPAIVTSINFLVHFFCVIVSSSGPEFSSAKGFNFPVASYFYFKYFSRILILSVSSKWWASSLLLTVIGWYDFLKSFFFYRLKHLSPTTFAVFDVLYHIVCFVIGVLEGIFFYQSPRTIFKVLPTFGSMCVCVCVSLQL